jgi:hypothetical protein
MWLDIGIVAVVLWFPLAFAVSGIRAWSGSEGTFWQLRDRVDVVTGAAECAGVLAIGGALGPWHLVPPAVWGLALWLALIGLLAGVLAGSALPAYRPGARPWSRRLALVLDVAAAAFLIVLVA